MPLTEDMHQFINATFRPEDRAAVASALEGATVHDGAPAGPRLLRCVLVGSGGSMANLNELVGLLRTDYRDVIMAGEYEYQGSEPVRVRDLNVPIVGAASNISFKADVEPHG